MVATQGIFAPGLITGTLIYFAIGVAASAVAISIAKDTKNITKGDAQKLGLAVVWIGVTCMWMFWAFVYMHQMMPLIFPMKQKVTAGNV